ncbi:MAG: DNA/RNA non-specific endonuclease [Candidatus Hydrogenedentes bacterium]|nr:DNA/RNA non-specific endonuclease [Candidatus Hydrogenedentota bacterium]
MRIRLSIISIAVVACSLFSVARADYLEVRRNATLKAAAERSAAVLRRLERGEVLLLLQNEQDNGYYHAQLGAGGPSGWIYRTLVRRYPGDPPEPQIEIDLLDDPTFPHRPTDQAYVERHLGIGKPQAVYERVREGYVLAYDPRLKIALWVQYELSREDLAGSRDRSDDFRPNPTIPAGSRSELRDYRGSGFDRGHMAPAAAMVRSETVMSESFLLSNMAPQVGGGFNRGIWRTLESAVRGWVSQRGTLTIITGPAFVPVNGEVSYRVIGDGNVAVPTHFFKIVVDGNETDNVQVLAFLLPNERTVDSDISDFLVSIDYLEELTGLNFLSALPNDDQRTLERDPSDGVW